MDTAGLVTELLFTESRVAAVTSDGPLATRALADAPTAPVVLVWRESARHPAIGQLVALAREVAASGQ